MNFDPTELSWLTLLARHPLRPDRGEFDAMLSSDGRMVADILQKLAENKPVDAFPPHLVEMANALRSWAASNPEPAPKSSCNVPSEELDRVGRVAEEEAW